MKVYVQAMSIGRSGAIKKLEAHADEIYEHIIKLIIYGKHRSTAYSHWLQEVASWFAYCDTHNVKQAKLSDKVYDAHLFPLFCSDPEDAADSLYQFQVDNVKPHMIKNPETALPYFYINDTMSNNLFECFQEIHDSSLKDLKSDSSHVTNYWRNKLDLILQKYIYTLQLEDIAEDIYQVR